MLKDDCPHDDGWLRLNKRSIVETKPANGWRQYDIYLVEIPSGERFPHEGYVLEVPSYQARINGNTLAISTRGRYEGGYLAVYRNPPKGTRHKRFRLSAESLGAILADELEKSAVAAAKLKRKKANAVQGPGALVSARIPESNAGHCMAAITRDAIGIIPDGNPSYFFELLYFDATEAREAPLARGRHSTSSKTFERTGDVAIRYQSPAVFSDSDVRGRIRENFSRILDARRERDELVGDDFRSIVSRISRFRSLGADAAAKASAILTEANDEYVDRLRNEMTEAISNGG